MLVAVLIIVLVVVIALAGYKYGLPALQGRSAAKKLSVTDRAYLEEVWNNAQGAFIDNPEAAVKLARTTVATFLQTHDINISGMPAAPGPDHQSASTEDLRLELLAIKEWVDSRVGVQ